jgi:uroporphyrin-III C-methyltransferase/precorrin-2 dehydrogenase/sirohydrochlorin ferrochelatase
MSRRTLPAIVDQLTGEGMTPDTPAVLAANVGREDQQIWQGSLGEIVQASADFSVDMPTIVAVGSALLARATGSEAGSSDENGRRLKSA